MAASEVDNVDIVADGGAVLGVVVWLTLGLQKQRAAVDFQLTVTENQQLIPFASGDLAEEGQQVEGNTLRVLTHDTTRVGTTRVKVSQEGTIPLLEVLAFLLEVVALSVDIIGDDILNHGLGSAVGVGGTNGTVLRDGNHVGEAGGIAVYGGGGGEDDVGDVVSLHGSEKGDAATDIDAVVLERNLTRLADGLRGC